MDMTDLIALKVRGKELEEENSRLKEILDLHGIEYKCKNNPEESETLEAKHAPTSDRKLSLQEKVAIFQELFQGRNDVFAKRWYSRTTQNRAINLYAKMNGRRIFAISGSINVQIVPTGNMLRFLTTIYLIILQEKTNGDVMS